MQGLHNLTCHVTKILSKQFHKSITLTPLGDSLEWKRVIFATLYFIMRICQYALLIFICVTIGLCAPKPCLCAGKYRLLMNTHYVNTDYFTNMHY